MSQTQAAAAADRLPWLADDPKTHQPGRRKDGHRDILPWALSAMLLVAIFSYWMGTRSWEPRQTQQGGTELPASTAAPQSSSAQPQQPQVVFEPAPQVSPAPVREVPIERPRAVRRSGQTPRDQRLARETPSTAKLDEVVATQEDAEASVKSTIAKPVVNPDSKPLTPWPATQSQGAKGRIVRVGAFGSRQQAKLGWRHMVRAYPAVAHLKATVVSDRNSRGRTFYRFQIGTTSQAHSEVLCQRMEKIRFSCAVVGLPWKPKGVER